MADWLMSWAVAALIFQQILGLGEWILAVFFLEVALFTALTGQSAGQRLFHIRVVRFSDGGQIAPLQVFIRTLLLCLVIPPLITDGHSRGLHDRISGSIVVKA
jgi:uncharacterized RDD family membrane protein YckC